MKGTVYKGVRLMPGSRALELLEAKNFKELDQHMRKLDLLEIARTAPTPDEAAQQIMSVQPVSTQLVKDVWDALIAKAKASPQPPYPQVDRVA